MPNVVVSLRISLDGRVVDLQLVDLEEVTVLNVPLLQALSRLVCQLLVQFATGELLVDLRCQHLLLLLRHELEDGLLVVRSWALGLLQVLVEQVVISIDLLYVFIKAVATGEDFASCLVMLRWDHPLHHLLLIQLVHASTYACVVRLVEVLHLWINEWVMRGGVLRADR